MKNNAIEQQFLLRLKLAMTRKGWNNSDLAERLKVSKQKVGRTLAGKQALKVPWMLEVCDALDVDVARAWNTAIEDARSGGATP